jgi:hypothetical protein
VFARFGTEKKKGYSASRELHILAFRVNM